MPARAAVVPAVAPATAVATAGRGTVAPLAPSVTSAALGGEPVRAQGHDASGRRTTVGSGERGEEQGREAGARVAVDELDARGEAADLSLQEAARLYGLSLATLGKRVRWGQIDAYKTRGPWGYEWRVSRQALEAQGYRQQPAPAGEREQDPRVATLEREVASLRRVVAAERLRADRADQDLGYALLECGRLRGALSRALGEPPRSEHSDDGGG